MTSNYGNEEYSINYEKNIAYYDDQLGQQHIREVMMENDFENALQNEEFEVWFQPKYNVQTEKIARCRGAYSLA